MSAAHTEGRLVVGRLIHGNRGVHFCAMEESTETAVAITGLVGEPDSELSYANARRLAACWNAFQDASTEVIEATVENGSLDTFIKVCARARSAEIKLDVARALLAELIDIEGPQPGTAAWAEKVRAFLKGDAT